MAETLVLSEDSVLKPFSDENGRVLWAKLCEFIGVDPKAPQHSLGGGTRGEAFLLPDNRVLKLTWDKSEAEAAAVVSAHPDPKGNVVRIAPNGVVQINVPKNGFRTGALYAIVQEHLTPMPDNDPFNDFAALWTDISGSFENPLLIEPQSIRKFFDEAENVHGVEFDEGWGDFADWLIDVAKYLKSVGVQYHDLHPSNVMMRGDQHVVIDLGYSRSKAVPEIETIAKLLAAAQAIERSHA